MFSGCATILGGGNSQTVSINSNKPVKGVMKYADGKGTQYFTAPATLNVDRRSKDIVLTSEVMIKRFFLLCFIPILLYSSQEDTVVSAMQIKLYEKNDWKALLHYDNGFKVTDKISLAYASENVKNPSSMMEHVFLKFSGKNDKNLKVNHAITFYTVKDIDMKYYFTSYNCSTVIYNMLSLAKPQIYNDKKIWITPLDSVKYLYKYDLIKKAQLYPSNSWLTKMLEDTNIDVNNTQQLQNKTIDISKYKSPNKIPSERQLSASYVNLNKEKYLKLSFLPASHQLNDYNREYFGESELKIASLSVLVNEKNITLQDFTLYGMKSYMPYSSLTHDL